MRDPNSYRKHSGNTAYLRTLPAFSDLSARGLALDLLEKIPAGEDLTLLAVGRVQSLPAVMAVTDASMLLAVPQGLGSGVHVYQLEAHPFELEKSGILQRATFDPAGEAFMFDFKSERDFKTFLDLTGSEPVGELPGVDKPDAPRPTNHSREREILDVINQDSVPANFVAPLRYAATKIKEDETVIAAATARYHEPCVLVLTDKGIRIVEREGTTHHLSLEIRYPAIDRVDKEKGNSLRIWQGPRHTTLHDINDVDMVRRAIDRMRTAAPAPAPAAATSVEELGKLAELFTAGLLTEEEFAAAKRKILNM